MARMKEENVITPVHVRKELGMNKFDAENIPDDTKDLDDEKA